MSILMSQINNVGPLMSQVIRCLEYYYFIRVKSGSCKGLEMFPFEEALFGSSLNLKVFCQPPFIK